MQRGMICAALGGDDAGVLASMVAPVEHMVDVVEVRLDLMVRPDVRRCLECIGKPLLFTNRPRWEGGGWGAGEDERVALLLEAAAAGAAYVDVELQTEKRLRRALMEGANNTQVILSSHNFTATPPIHELERTLAEIIDSGADIGKIVTTAHCPADVFAVLLLQQKALERAFPLSCFAMGSSGKISRLATLYLGGFMSYVAVTTETAPGQFTAGHLHELISLFEQQQE